MAASSLLFAEEVVESSETVTVPQEIAAPSTTPRSFKSRKCCPEDSIVIRRSDLGQMGVIINKPGRYCLSKDLSFCPKSDCAVAITIKANNVTLDLNGNTLKQVNDKNSTIGIVICENRHCVRVVNGTIENFGALGIYVRKGCSGIELENLNILDSGSRGCACDCSAKLACVAGGIFVDDNTVQKKIKKKCLRCSSDNISLRDIFIRLNPGDRLAFRASQQDLKQTECTIVGIGASHVRNLESESVQVYLTSPVDDEIQAPSQSSLQQEQFDLFAFLFDSLSDSSINNSLVTTGPLFNMLLIGTGFVKPKRVLHTNSAMFFPDVSVAAGSDVLLLQDQPVQSKKAKGSLGLGQLPTSPVGVGRIIGLYARNGLDLSLGNNIVFRNLVLNRATLIRSGAMGALV